MIAEKPSITKNEILAIHNLILKGIDNDNAGRYRSIPVRISGSTVILPNPRKVSELMNGFEDWLILGAACPVDFGKETSLGIERSQVGQYYNIDPPVIAQSRGFFKAKIDRSGRAEYSSAKRGIS